MYQQALKLLSIFDHHKQIIFAVDFDDTIKMSTNKSNLFLTQEICELLAEGQRLVNDKFKVIIFTCRHESDYEFIEKYCKDRNINVVVNQQVYHKFDDRRKIYCNMQIDDKTLCLEEQVKILRDFIELLKSY